MLRNKLDHCDFRYTYFLDKGKIYRDKIKKEEATEEEYISWMNQYWEKIKADAKAAKQANK